MREQRDGGPQELDLREGIRLTGQEEDRAGDPRPMRNPRLGSLRRSRRVERIREQDERAVVRAGLGRSETGHATAVGVPADADVGCRSIRDRRSPDRDDVLSAAFRQVDRGGGDPARLETANERFHRCGVAARPVAQMQSDRHGIRVPFRGRILVPMSDIGRCPWGDDASGDRRMQAYHDDEWGVAVTDDGELFERLILECFQAGLSWRTILNKREAFRAAFRGFDPATVAAFRDTDRDRLMADAGIVRNRSKIDASIGNAAAFLAVVAEFGSFDAYLRSIVPTPPTRLASVASMGDIPATTDVSDALSADLRRRGFRFVGSTIVYAFMQSVGLVDDHVAGCFRYRGDPG